MLYQHGIVLPTIKIPYKINYSKVYVFDRYSQQIFRDCYVSNTKCEYKIYDFKPSFDFQVIANKKQDIFYIGIAEQSNPKWVESILDEIEKEFTDVKYVCYIMLHPNSNYQYVRKNVFTTREKYINIDVLITDFSTLPLDYYRQNKDVKIIFTKDVKCFMDYPFIKCIYVPELGKVVMELKGKKDEEVIYCS